MTEVKVKWSSMGDSTNLYFLFCFLFNSFALYFYFAFFFFSCLDLMGIILRVFQGISLHQNWRWTFTLSCLLLKQGLAAETTTVPADSCRSFAPLTAS